MPLKKKKVPISYTSRDFNSIKRDLIEHTKRYYSNTFRDFNEASFGSLMFDTVSYIGDILSFYLDYQANESFLDTALEYDNILKLGRALGYKFKGNPSSYGTCAFYITVPANSNGVGPDTSYLPILKAGSSFGTNGGNGFILNESVDFSNGQNEVVVAAVDSSTGLPLSYAVKASGRVISGELFQEEFIIQEFERFLRLELSGENITEVISVIDSAGHEYFEVPNLSQNVVFQPVINRVAADSEDAPQIMKPVVVPRRFTVERDRDTTFLQFGYGSESEIKSDSIVDPSTVIMKIHGKSYTTDDSFDPTKIIETDKFGIAPSNTVLTVAYRSNSSEQVNTAAETVTEVVDPRFDFKNLTSLSDNLVASVINSLEVTNEEPIVGDVTIPDSEELKIRIYDNHSSQNRAVTKQDYKSAVYHMPPEFGAVKRVNIVQDRNSFKRNLNMYVISENQNGTLVQTNDTIKKNLKTWLASQKMVNDTVDILDAIIMNISVEFEIVADDEVNRFAILERATAALADVYRNHFDIGESFNISEAYTTLNRVPGVMDTTSVRVVKKTGGQYRSARFDIDAATSPDGRLIVVPENVILEIKFPGIDIVGSVR